MELKNKNTMEIKINKILKNIKKEDRTDKWTNVAKYNGDAWSSWSRMVTSSALSKTDIMLEEEIRQIVLQYLKKFQKNPLNRYL